MFVFVFPRICLICSRCVDLHMGAGKGASGSLEAKVEHKGCGQSFWELRCTNFNASLSSSSSGFSGFSGFCAFGKGNP